MPSPSSRPLLPAGILSGASYQKLLQTCLSENYALPAINISNINMLNAALEAAAENGSDIILQISHGGAQFYGGLGIKDTERARLLGALSMARHAHLVAQEYNICVILHTDHAIRAHLPWIDALIKANQEFYSQYQKPLFSSHMLDLSTESLEDNIHISRAYLKELAPLEIGLEIELGMTGGEEDGIGHELEEEAPFNPLLYTTPSNILTAWDALSPHGMVSIAASFGNVHGVYRPGKIELRPKILQQAQRKLQERHKLSSRIPFVFHGGSGSDITHIKEAISYGVFKMNIDTDTQFAFAQGVGKFVEEHSQAFKTQIDPNTHKPLKKFYDPRKWLREGEKTYSERLTQSFAVLGSQNRSLARHWT